jgi:hypothetical protein
MGKVANERINLAQGERRGGLPLEVAPDEAIVGDLELPGGGAGVLDRGGAVLLDQREDPEDAAHPGLAVSRASVVGGVRGGRSAG